MANTYMETSSWINIPKSKLVQAEKICKRISERLEKSEEGYCSIAWAVSKELGQSGIWFFNNESFNTDHLETMARALVEKLKLGPFFASWAYTCDNPRIDEFGGGAFAVIRGQDTIWCDAMSNVQEQVKKGK